MDVDTRIKYNSVTFVFGVFLLLNLQYGQASSKDNQTSEAVSIVVMLEPPYVIKDPKTGKFSGLMIDVLSKAGIAIDHVDTIVQDTYDVEKNPDDFTGIIGDLVNGKYDLAVAPFSIRSKSAKYITFTQPVLHHGYRSLYKIPKDTEWNFDRIDALATLLKPFSPGLWCLIILTSLLASITLFVIRRFSPYEDDVIGQGSQRADNSLTTMSWGSGLMYLLGSLTGRDVSVTPRSTSGRILTVVWWIFSLMTVGAYIAGLVVILFKENPHLRTLPFATLDEIISQTDVKFLGVKDSPTYKYIADHKGYFESMVLRYWKNNWDTVMVDSYEEAMSLVNKGDGKYAVLLSEGRAEYLASLQPCDKMVIGDPVGDVTIGFACSKDSTVCDTINHAILELKENGHMQKFKEKYFQSGCRKSSAISFEGSAIFDTFGGKEPGLLSPDGISIRRFSGAFLVLLIGFLGALLVLVAEICYSRRKGNVHYHMKNIARDEDAQVFRDDDFSEDRDA